MKKSLLELLENYSVVMREVVESDQGKYERIYVESATNPDTIACVFDLPIVIGKYGLMMKHADHYQLNER